MRYQMSLHNIEFGDIEKYLIRENWKKVESLKEDVCFFQKECGRSILRVSSPLGKIDDYDNRLLNMLCDIGQQEEREVDEVVDDILSLCIDKHLRIVRSFLDEYGIESRFYNKQLEINKDSKSYIIGRNNNVLFFEKCRKKIRNFEIFNLRIKSNNLYDSYQETYSFYFLFVKEVMSYL